MTDNSFLNAFWKLVEACRLHASKTRYSCAQCGSEASVIAGAIERACDHDEAAVLAEAAATMSGSGAMHGVS